MSSLHFISQQGLLQAAVLWPPICWMGVETSEVLLEWSPADDTYDGFRRLNKRFSLMAAGPQPKNAYR